MSILLTFHAALCIYVYMVVYFIMLRFSFANYVFLFLCSYLRIVMLCFVLGIRFHCVFLCVFWVSLCTVLLPPGVNSIAVNINIISYHIISFEHSFKEHLPEDGHNRRPENLSGNNDSNVIRIHIRISICWLFLIRNHQCTVKSNFKMYPSTFLQYISYSRTDVYR